MYDYNFGFPADRHSRSPTRTRVICDKTRAAVPSYVGDVHHMHSGILAESHTATVTLSYAHVRADTLKQKLNTLKAAARIGFPLGFNPGASVPFQLHFLQVCSLRRPTQWEVYFFACNRWLKEIKAASVPWFSDWHRRCKCLQRIDTNGQNLKRWHLVEVFTKGNTFPPQRRDYMPHTHTHTECVCSWIYRRL